MKKMVPFTVSDDDRWEIEKMSGKVPGVGAAEYCPLAENQMNGGSGTGTINTEM